ncbi:MAG: hypothetical protein JWR12_810 [Mucilaginibacter sp.]|nr:hypothetical protein [Mucilaginibacter sp.]
METKCKVILRSSGFRIIISDRGAFGTVGDALVRNGCQHIAQMVAQLIGFMTDGIPNGLGVVGGQVHVGCPHT